MMQPSPQGPPPTERASLQAIALSLGHDPGRVRCRTRPPMIDLSCRTCTGGTSGGGCNQDVWLREPPQFRTLVRRAHATPGRSAGPHGAPAAHALASKHGAGPLRLPAPCCPPGLYVTPSWLASTQFDGPGSARTSPGVEALSPLSLRPCAPARPKGLRSELHVVARVARRGSLLRSRLMLGLLTTA